VSPTLSPIGRPQDLAPIAARLAESPRIALDTEFMRERTYYAELALIQTADASGIALLDPLAELDPAAITAVIHHPQQCKVLHAARQDVEVLLPLTGTPIGPIVDTQVAASLCGYGPQIGYGELVAKELNVVLEKGQARTDWKRRPLSPAQLAYAADDVRYLLPLAAQLEEKLAELGRSAWLAEDLAALADPRLYRVEPTDAWQRFKGIEALPVREQMRLRALAAWREERAIQRNLPRGWVLPDEVARTLARVAPRTVEDVERLDLMPSGAVEKLGPEILAALAHAESLPMDGVVQRVEGRPDPVERERQKRLGDAAKHVAAHYEVAPEVLATQRDLRRIARGESIDRVFSGWRLSLLAEPLARVVD
jgi:ribonuclease D